MQDGDNSLYYEISTMEGSGDTCAIICICGSGGFRGPLTLHVDAKTSLVSVLGSVWHSRLASLVKDATSIRLFHLRSIEASEGELAVPNSVKFHIDRPPSPKSFSTAFRGAKFTCSDDRPGQVHYHERSSPVGLRSVYLFRWHETTTYHIASVYFPRPCRL